jgi:hypothetical protein
MYISNCAYVVFYLIVRITSCSYSSCSSPLHDPLLSHKSKAKMAPKCLESLGMDWHNTADGLHHYRRPYMNTCIIDSQRTATRAFAGPYAGSRWSRVQHAPSVRMAPDDDALQRRAFCGHLNFFIDSSRRSDRTRIFSTR